MKFRVEKSRDRFTWYDMGIVEADETGGCVLDGRNGVDNCFWRFTPIAEVPTVLDAEAQAQNSAAQAAAQAGAQMPTGLAQQQAAGATGNQEPA